MNHKLRQIPVWLFWSSLGLIVYTYLIFPLLVVLRGVLRPKPILKAQVNLDPNRLMSSDNLSSVSFIIAAYNEAAVIGKKLENALSLNYPSDRLQVIVASDGSEDATNSIVGGFVGPQIKLLTLPRQGKNATINQAVAAAEGEILVFTDADSMLAADSILYLVAPFADCEVGGVGGSYHYEDNGEGGEGERAYWSFDRRLKELQSGSGNITGTTGHIYAIRHDLFAPVPPGVTDDSFISREVIRQHRRLVWEPQAIAYGPIADNRGEFQRKVRITTRGLNAVWVQRYLLNPFEYGFYSLQLFSHKVLRRLMVIPLLLIGLTTPFLWARGWLYQVAAFAQFGLHTSALLGHLLQSRSADISKLLSFPYYLDMTNVAALRALVDLLRGRSRDVWDAQRTSTPSKHQ